jgi:hypothetical protein
MLALGVRPDTSYDEPVHVLGERAFDSSDPTKEYQFVQIDTSIPANALCKVDGSGVATAAAGTDVVRGVLETAIDGSAGTKYGWLTVRGITGGRSGLTAQTNYWRVLAAGALVGDPSGDLGHAVSATQLYLNG